MCSGAYFSFSEPTAETERMRSTPERLQGEDVGLEVELAGQDAVAAPVAGQEGDAPALERAHHERGPRAAPNGVSTAISRDVREALHLVEAAAPDDPDLRRRRHLDALPFHELQQHARRRARVDERDLAPAGADARRLVEQRDARAP